MVLPCQGADHWGHMRGGQLSGRVQNTRTREHHTPAERLPLLWGCLSPVPSSVNKLRCVRSTLIDILILSLFLNGINYQE